MFSFHFDLQSMEPRINGPAFVHALKLMQQLQKHRPEGSALRPAEAFARGEAVLCLGEARSMEQFRRGKVAGKFGVCRIPGAREVLTWNCVIRVTKL